MKRLRVGNEFWDSDWQCMNDNSQWSDDEITKSVNPINEKLAKMDTK